MSENCSIMLLRYYWATVFDRELQHCITEISLRCQRTVALCYWDIIKLCQKHAALLLRYFKSPVAPHYWDIIEIHVCQRPVTVALCYWDIEISLILNCFCATCYAEVPYLCYKYIMGRDFVVYLILFIFHNTQIMLVVNYLINSISKKNTRLCWWPMVRDYTFSIYRYITKRHWSYLKNIFYYHYPHIRQLYQYKMHTSMCCHGKYFAVIDTFLTPHYNQSNEPHI